MFENALSLAFLQDKEDKSSDEEEYGQELLELIDMDDANLLNHF